MSDAKLSPRSRLLGLLKRLAWPLTLTATIIYASSNQVVTLPNTFNGLDKVAHLLLFGLLATHIIRLPVIPANRLALRQAVLAVAVTFAFGVSDELHQAFNPYRSFDYYDMLADLCGPLLAVGLYRHCRPYRRLLELRLFGRRERLV